MDNIRVEANGKWVELVEKAEYDAPPTWHLKTPEGEFRISVPMQATQLELVKQYQRVYDSQKDIGIPISDDLMVELVESDWSFVGNEDDVWKFIFTSVGYDQQNLIEDKSALKELVRHAAEQLETLKSDTVSSVDSFDPETDTNADDFFESTSGTLSEMTKLLAETKKSLKRYKVLLEAAERWVAKESMGLNWTNETFLSNYGETPEAKRLMDTYESRQK